MNKYSLLLALVMLIMLTGISISNAQSVVQNRSADTRAAETVFVAEAITVETPTRRRGITTHSTGLAISLSLKLKLDSSPVNSGVGLLRVMYELSLKDIPYCQEQENG